MPSYSAARGIRGIGGTRRGVVCVTGRGFTVLFADVALADGTAGLDAEPLVDAGLVEAVFAGQDPHHVALDGVLEADCATRGATSGVPPSSAR